MTYPVDILVDNGRNRFSYPYKGESMEYELGDTITYVIPGIVEHRVVTVSEKNPAVPHYNESGFVGLDSNGDKFWGLDSQIIRIEKSES